MDDLNGEVASIDVTAPLLEFLRSLDRCFEENPEVIEGEREQIATALCSVGRFLRNVDPSHASRFFELGQIFADLNMGARHPLIEARKKRARPLPSEIQAAKADVAFALDALIQLGDHPDAAAKLILQRFPRIENLAGSKSRNMNSEAASRKTILEWRKSLRSNRQKNDLAVELFAAGQALIAHWIKEGRGEDLRKRAMGRAHHAEGVAKRRVFVSRSNPR